MNIDPKNITIKFLVIGLLLVVMQPVHALNAICVQQQQPVTLLEQIMKDRPVLVQLLTTAGYAPLLTGDAPYTLLAPPEQDIKALKNESPEKIRAIMAGYILKGKHIEKSLKDGTKVETLAGTSLSIYRKDGHTLINGVRITHPDNDCKNGVIHGLAGALNS